MISTRHLTLPSRLLMFSVSHFDNKFTYQGHSFHICNLTFTSVTFYLNTTKLINMPTYPIPSCSLPHLINRIPLLPGLISVIYQHFLHSSFSFHYFLYSPTLMILWLYQDFQYSNSLDVLLPVHWLLYFLATEFLLGETKILIEANYQFVPDLLLIAERG